MANLCPLSDALPVTAPLFQKGADFDVQRVLCHSPAILGKFSSSVKEHITNGRGHPPGMAEDGTINRVLARNLAYWMSEAKLTQSALAERAGVSQKTISNYLNPDQRVEGSKGKEPSAKLTELAKVAHALGIGTWQLLREMSESERKLYASIEQSYDLVRKQAEEAANAARKEADRKILNDALLASKKTAVSKKKAA